MAYTSLYSPQTFCSWIPVIIQHMFTYSETLQAYRSSQQVEPYAQWQETGLCIDVSMDATWLFHSMLLFSVYRLGSLVGGLQVGFEPRRKALSNVDVALGYIDKDIIFHIKLCVLFRLYTCSLRILISLQCYSALHCPALATSTIAWIRSQRRPFWAVVNKSNAG